MKRADVLKQPLIIVIAILALLIAVVSIRVIVYPTPSELSSLADMPLGLLIDNYAAGSLGGLLISIVLILLSAVILTRIVVRYSLSPVRTYLPIVLFTTLSTGIYVAAGSLSTFVCSTLLVFSTDAMIASFRRSYEFEKVFRSAFILGLLPMLNSSAVVLLPILAVTLVIYHKTPREVIVAVAGVVLPFIMCTCAWWIAGWRWGYLATQIAAGISTKSLLTAFAAILEGGYPTIALAIVCSSILILSIILALARLQQLRTRAHKIVLHFLWLLFFALSMALLPSSSPLLIYIVAPAATVLITFFFIRLRGFFPLAVYLVMLILLFAGNLTPFFG